MNVAIMIGVIVVMVALRFLKPNILIWFVAWWAGVYAVVVAGIEPPLPASIVNMFMAIVTVSLLAYLYSDSERLASAKRPIVRFMVDKKYTVPLVVVVLMLPALVAYKVYSNRSGGVEAPVFGRTIHPAPPERITVAGQTIDLINDVNPFRGLETTDREAFDEHVQNGRRVYYENCVFCHGDDAKGDGIFAHALDPIPANFDDPTTIAMLQESYLFWRIAKGGPGLPEESSPWASAMPVWERMLTEEEIWDVILFLYEHTGRRPRAREFEE